MIFFIKNKCIAKHRKYIEIDLLNQTKYHTKNHILQSDMMNSAQVAEEDPAKMNVKVAHAFEQCELSGRRLLNLQNCNLQSLPPLIFQVSCINLFQLMCFDSD
jgi:hypothetical protein